VLKGIHTQGLNDASQFNQWQSDATPNQLRTDGWLVMRMGKGMLISSTARPDQTYSAQGSQMDVQEATSELKGAQDLQQRLSDTATQAQALTPSIDVTQQGRYSGTMNGQATTYPAIPTKASSSTARS
jgi:Putative type VI secretion system Rhs element Vgr